MSMVPDSAAQYDLSGPFHGDTTASNVWLVPGDDAAQLAAASAPDDVAVYGVDMRLLKFGGDKPSNMNVVKGASVVVFPHGDAASDPSVFDRLGEFGRWCGESLASDVQFAWISSRLNIFLADYPESEHAECLRGVVHGVTGRKPAKAKPRPTVAYQLKQAREADFAAGLEQPRPVIDVNEDRKIVIDSLVDALRNGPDAERLFNLGGRLAITRKDPNTLFAGRTIMENVDDEVLLNVLTECTQMVTANTRGFKAAWPETKTITALYGRYGDFRPLRGIAPSPIVRADNTIASTPGYDEESQVLIDLGDLEVEIPEAPTKAEVDAAVALLMDEWLGDFPFASDADRTNMLAFILTYPLRDLVNLVPLAVFSAKSMGTGKSKLLTLVARLFTGNNPEMDSLPNSEEEVRKQITTLLQKASPYLIFDETDKIGGKSINRLLTASSWSDRILGGNERATLPNRAVMASAGNNVEVLGDTGRRYYPIELFYDGEDPESRPESDFIHPDVEAWADEHRGELLTAVFTLIRAWQNAGRPKRATSFGSYERWEAVIGGVIENAGVEGFLANLKEHRKSADFEEGVWNAHCAWLEATFPSGQFTARDVVDKMTRKHGALIVVQTDADLPPGISVPPSDSSYTLYLSRLYSKRAGRWSDGYRISKQATKTDNKTTWTIEVSPRRQQERAAAKAASMVVNPALHVEAQQETEEAFRLMRSAGYKHYVSTAESSQAVTVTNDTEGTAA